MNATTPLLQGATALTGAAGMDWDMDWAGALRARVLDEGVLSVSPVATPLHGTGLPIASDYASSLLIGAHVAPFSTRDDATGLPPRGAPV